MFCNNQPRFHVADLSELATINHVSVYRKSGNSLHLVLPILISQIGTQLYSFVESNT